MASIVFIHRLTREEETKWLTRLESLLPTENIFLPSDLTASEAKKIDIAIVANPDIETLQRFPNLVWVQSLWAGVEGLVNGFRQLNGQNHSTSTQLVRLIDPNLANTMAEAVLAWTLFLHRNIPEYAAQQRKKLWKPIEYVSANQLRVSVLGAGELGQASMQRLLQQGYQVNSWSRGLKNISGVEHFYGDNGLISLLKITDILVCLLPLTEQTRTLLNETTLQHLPKGAKLINFARGGVINHGDLQLLLDTHHISHAVLDVFDKEPLDKESPLWEHEHISILPHISATTNLETASSVAAENIKRYRTTGVIPQSVDLIKGY